MQLDISFKNVIQKFFEECKIEMCFVNVSVYYETSMKKNLIKLTQKGIREIDILLTVPGTIKQNGTIVLVDPVILFFDRNIMNEAIAKKGFNEKHCHLISKAALWAIMSVWKVTTPDNSVFYTFKDVHEVGTNSVLKMRGMNEA